MEEKKKRKNVFALISLCLMVLTFILELIGLMKASFVCVVISIITGIGGIVLSIMGIVKATKLKREMGKLKGLAISIICIIVILGVLALSYMEFMVLMNEQKTGNRDFTNLVNSANLSQEEQITGQYIKRLKNSLNDIDSLKINNIYQYKSNGQTPINFNMIIDFSAKNLAGGTTRQFVILSYTYENGYTSISRRNSLQEAEKSVYYAPSITTKSTIDKKKILDYADKDTTQELKIDYDSEEVQKKLNNAIKGMGY